MAIRVGWRESWADTESLSLVPCGGQSMRLGVSHLAPPTLAPLTLAWPMLLPGLLSAFTFLN